ncbi:hypothetical protein EDB86DRAFT_445097 [Lactarius hatsudake]|nr:hypothetical protein EDB86DRAFT_445097 [Lactarius hatsudake]
MPRLARIEQEEGELRRNHQNSVDQNSLILMRCVHHQTSSGIFFLERGCGFGPVSTHGRQGKHKPTGQIDLRGGARGGGGLYVSYVQRSKSLCQLYNVCKNASTHDSLLADRHLWCRCAKPCDRCRSPEKPRDLQGTAALRWARPCQHISVGTPTHHATRSRTLSVRDEVGLLPPASEGGGVVRGLRRRQSKASTKTACTARTGKIGHSKGFKVYRNGLLGEGFSRAELSKDPGFLP